MRFLWNRNFGPQPQLRSYFSGNSGWQANRCAKFFLPGCAAGLECLLNALNDRFPNSGWITKTHFAFRRVNIYIDTRRIELEKEERHRVLAFHESRMIAFTDRASNKAAFNRAAIYKNELLRSGLAAQTSLSGKATDPNL